MIYNVPSNPNHSMILQLPDPGGLAYSVSNP